MIVSSLLSIKKFIKLESLGGIILILSTIAAVIWANSTYADVYHNLWHNINLGFTVGDFELKGNIHHWINDGLMAIFFFTIGLEIKREIIGGELSTMKKASLPIIAAIGGMIVPAIFYSLTNITSSEYINGWGIPMATDIAFALGLLAMLGDRVNINIRIFLTALAIADDLGAILVIAIFYTESINYAELINAAIFLIILLTANKLGVRKTTFYAIVGLVGVWISFLFSGVHATIAGVLIAFTIPARPKINENIFISKIGQKIKEFQKTIKNNNSLLTHKQSHLISDIDKLADDASTPLQNLEHFLHPIATFFILPLFALANAGIHVEGNILEMIFHPISLGIIIGLVLGKAIGISGFVYLARMLKISTLPEGINMRQIIGAGMMAGIGFTMSIFIADLAFTNPEYVQIAKIGIFTASIIAAVIGMIILSKK